MRQRFRKVKVYGKPLRSSVCERRGRKSADQRAHLLGGTGKIDLRARHLFAREPLALLFQRNLARDNAFQRRYDELRAQLCKLIRKRAAGIRFLYRKLFAQERIARIHADVRFHNGDARFRRTVHKCAGDGSGAAIGGKQTRVHVPYAKRKQIEHFLR